MPDDYVDYVNPTVWRIWGGTFNDYLLNESISRIERILVRSGSRIDKITIVYRLVDGREEIHVHGGEGGNDNPEIVFADHEDICGVGLRCGSAVDSLMFITCRNGRVDTLKRYGPYGGRGGEEHAIYCQKVVAFYGRSGAALDAIGFLCNPPVIIT